MMKQFCVLLYPLRERGLFCHLEDAVEQLFSFLILPHLKENSSFGLKVARHRRDIIYLLGYCELPVHSLQRLVHTARVQIDDRHPEERGSTLAVASGAVQDLL